MNRRRGHSLIEVIVAMTVATTMLGTVVVLLYTLLGTERAAREHVHRCSVLGRLADQFRRDVHAARRFVGGEDRQFELAPDRTVSYRAERGKLIRTERAGGTLRRESFSLPPDATASIQVRDDTEPAIASLVITPVAGQARKTPTRAIRVEAVLAKDHRFTRTEEP